MKVAFHTLGCKVNSYESQAMLNMFEEAGYQEVDFKEEADVYVVNTCTVTNTGDSKSRQMIRKAIRKILPQQFVLWDVIVKWLLKILKRLTELVLF